MFILHLSKIRVKMLTLGLLFIGLIMVDAGSIGVTRSDLPAPLERIKTADKVIALTVNVDWGEEIIPGILEVLDQYQAKATFFVTGRWAKNHPELIKEMDSRGHQIGNHGYYHSHPDQLPIAKTKEEISATERVVEEIIGKKTLFYAPPYGERGPNGIKAASELGYTTVLWTLDTIDWRADSTPEIIAQRILNPKIRHGIKPVKSGAIVLMHPKENTMKALPMILTSLQEDGFQMVTVEKLITYN